MEKDIKLMSACLLGVECRYDGKGKPCEKAIELFKKGNIVPVCPEQLSGFSTPRISIEVQEDGRVLSKEGKDVTSNLQKGAEETLKIAKMVGAKEFIAKSKSPSCGFGKTYDGTFSGNLVDKNGFVSDFLNKNGIKIITEEEL